MTRIRRLATRLGLARNPMRRRSDKIASGAAAGLVALFLAGAPVATIALGHLASQAVLAEQHDQRAWRQVPAVLLRSATPPDGYYYSGGWAWARWTAPGGRTMTGVVAVPAGAKKGGHAPVWTDGTGHYTGGPPLSRDMALVRVTEETVCVPVAAAIVLLLTWWGIRAVLTRRQLSAWEEDWAATGPRWTHQFRTHGL